MACTHITSARFTLPSAFTQVHREECTQCFDSQDLPEGIDVCLTCFNGGCRSDERHHARNHVALSGHNLAVNIHRVVIDKPKRPDDGTPPPQKMSKLAIVPEDEETKYEHVAKVRCYACDEAEVAKDATPELTQIVDAVLSSMSSAKQSEVKAWEEEIHPCEHTLCLQQDPPRKLEQQSLAHCKDCELNENLWLCLTCGNLGCGRRHFDGSGGNNHGLDHFTQTGHGVSCKLGTITPEGTADIYCYLCDDAKLDNDLSTHLANWGINVSQQLKTEKSMTELQLEQNLKFDFSMTTEDGKQLEPKFGPGYTGLKNLGNSCYMASILQSVFDVPAFQDRYYQQLADHAQICVNDPASCWHCQLHKIADGLLSGRYSQPVKPANENDSPSQEGIAPAMFKTLVGKGHEEFSTMRQQDAYEFFQYLMKSVAQKEHAAKATNPARVFEFAVEHRLQCGKCKRVRYQTDTTNSLSVDVPARKSDDAMTDNEDGAEVYAPVDFYECMDTFVADELVDGYQCPHCQEKTTAHKSQKLATFPQILVVHARRFAFVNWVPRKLNVQVQFPEGEIQLDKYQGKGLQPGEEELPEDQTTAASASTEPEVDAGALEQLMTMGFPENRCKRALITTGNNGAELAMGWILEHMDDPSVDDPITAPSSGAGAGSDTGASDEQVSMLCAMGFSPAQAKKALKETGNNPERAVDWLFSHPEDTGEEDEPATAAADAAPPGDATGPFHYHVQSFVSHKGTSVHCGHYVAHVRKEGKWVLFNDNRVAESPNPPIGEAYVYFLQRD